MAKVKGSKQQRMIVVPYRPGYELLIRLFLVVIIVAVGAGFYFFGFNQGVSENQQAISERDLLNEKVIFLENELINVEQQLVNSTQAGILDKQALDDVHGTIVTLNERIIQLEEDILFYKEIMDPENNEQGLIIGQFDLYVSDLGPQLFDYRLELRKLGDSQTLINGFVNINILGIEDGNERSIPLRSVSTTVSELDIRINFQYFQNLEGEIELPTSFVPEKIQILAVAEGSNSKTVQRTFGWVVQNK